jgi:hypothetical protein
MEKQSHPIGSIIGDYRAFLDEVLGHLMRAGFSYGEFEEVDHLAYRTESLDNYEKMKRELIRFARTFDESNFNGRKILVCRLESPLMHGEFVIEGIELLAPKPDNKYAKGLEHAEFVIKAPLEEFREKHKEADFDLSAYGRDVNPELRLRFGNCAAKFHTRSLLEIRKI